MTSELNNLLFKVKYLKALIPVMSPDDQTAFTLCTLALIRGNLTMEQLKTINDLYDKFEEHK
jgi:hypothetical protein